MAAAVAMLVVLSGCAPEHDPSWRPVQWPVYGQVVDEAPTTVAPTAVATAGQRLRNDDVRIEARWAYLPGTQPVNGVISQVVHGAVAAQSQASGIPYHPQAYAAGAGLGDRGCVQDATAASAADLLGAATDVHAVVVCDIVRASGAVFGERLRVVQGSASAVQSDTTTIVYTDIGSGQVGTAHDLFADVGKLWDDLIEVLRRDAGSLSVRTPDAPTADDLASLAPALDSATFGASQLVLQLPVGFTAPALRDLAGVPASTPDKPVFVALDTDAIADALSPLGLAVADAAGPTTITASAGAGFDRVDCDLMPCMALTLDDGPSDYTPGILDVLHDQHAAATFYELGQNAQRHPDTVRRVAAEGHQVGNHTWNHPYLTKLDDAAIRSQLGSTAQVLRDLSGQPVTTFRPPGGFIDDHVLAIAGETAVLWSVDTRDWAGPADATLLRYAIDTPAPSTIMLMHDIQPVTSRVFPEVVAGLNDRGFALVTIDTLFGGTPPPGIVRHGP